MVSRKKVAALILGAVIGVQCAGAYFSVYAQENTMETAVVSEECAARLRAIGAIYDLSEEETENLSADVSRGEFAKILVKYFRKQNIYDNISEKPYVDVELSNPYARDIKTAKDLGYIYDVQALRYRPDDTITLNEAAVMLLRGLGYTNLTKKEAISAASSMDIFDKISKDRDSGASLNEIYIMLENALNAELMDREYLNGVWGYTLSGGETVLSRYYDTEKRRGIVTANSHTGLSEASAFTGGGSIEIDGVIYEADSKDFGQYIGYVVDYYLLSDDRDKVIYIAPYKKNMVTEIKAEDLSSATNSQIKYFNEKQQEKTIKLEKNFDVIYNEKAYSGYGVLGDILPQDGKLIAIDNDDDGAAEVVLITSYEYYQVNSLDSEKEIVYTNDENVKIDLSDTSGEVEILNVNGNRANFAGIKKNCVITVAKSKNTDGNQYTLVIVSEQTVNGSITSTDNGDVFVNGKKYETVQAIRNTLSAGNTGVFYIAHNGKIAFFESASADVWSVGLVDNIYYDSESGGEYVVLSLFTPYGEFAKYRIADKVKVNKTMDNPTGQGGKAYVYSHLSKGDVIRYTLDKNGIVNKIEMSDNGRENSDGTRNYIDENSLRLLDEADTFYYRNNIFNGVTAMDAGTICYVIPPVQSWSEKDNFYTTTSSVLTGNVYEYSFPYKAYVFDESDAAVADILVLQTVIDTSNMSNEEPLYTIDRIEQVYRNDEVDNQLVVFGNGGKSVFYCKDDIISKYGIRNGDIIQLLADNAKNIKSVKKIMNDDGSSDYGAVLVPGEVHDNGDYRYSGRLVYGTVKKLGDEYIEFTASLTGEGKSYIGLIKYCQYTKIYQKDDEVSAAAYSDLAIGDKFVAIVSSGMVRDMVIVKP